jgi:hypothetical protein
MTKSNRIFVVPNNDAEAVEIISMLNTKGETVLITGQAWGASWANLEADIKDAIEATNCTVYGVELAGEALSTRCVNIDHHCYEGDDRTNEKSSIEQVADLLGTNLTVEQQFISANDKGYIPQMRALGEELGLDKETVEALVADTRKADRNAQGITAEQEAAAEEAIASKEVVGDLTVVELAHSKCATVTDRLFGQYTELLIVCGDGEVDYYGSHNTVSALQSKFGGWSGNGFWGSCEADAEEVKATLM